MTNSKPRIIKDYEKLSEEIKEQVKLAYPDGFSGHVIDFFGKDGIKISALPFETEDKYLMIRMTVKKAKKIIEEDEDYDDFGMLKEKNEVELDEAEDFVDPDFVSDSDE